MLPSVVAVFLRLGLTAVGGPAAHVALLRHEAVERRRWVTDGEFLDLLAATNLIPGPNSTEMVIHIGRRVAGWRGLVLAGAAFILPAALIVLACAWAYARYGTVPQVAGLMRGINPVIIAIIADAVWRLARAGLRDRGLSVVAAVSVGLALAGAIELALLGGAGAAAVLMRRHRPRAAAVALGATLAVTATAAAAAAGGTVPVTLARLAGFFLKVGSILFGSGYVLVAFMRADLVERWSWLTDRQLLDAIAIGQVTPGPVLTTATFVGYLLAGVAGAITATVAIFLPAFVFVALTQPLIPRLRASAGASAFLSGVTAASLGLMASVCVQLASTAITDVWTGGLALIACGTLVVSRLNPTWLVVGGALAGWLVLP